MKATDKKCIMNERDGKRVWLSINFQFKNVADEAYLSVYKYGQEPFEFRK